MVKQTNCGVGGDENNRIVGRGLVMARLVVVKSIELKWWGKQ